MSLATPRKNTNIRTIRKGTVTDIVPLPGLEDGSRERRRGGV